MSKMKIAIATEKGKVSGHFGKCEQFTLYEVEAKEVIRKEVLDTKAHGHGLLPAFLASKDIRLVIAGGMGEGAKKNLDSLGLEAVVGVSGDVDEVIQKYLKGALEASEAGCHHHSHDHGKNHSCSCHSH